MKNKFGKIMYVLVILVCLIFFILSALYLTKKYYNDMQESKIIEEIRLEKEKAETEKIKENEEKQKEYKEEQEIPQKADLEEVKAKKQILKEYKDLYKKNNDLYGWIKIDETEIDYPIMFTPEEPNFYENKNLEKEICNNGVGTVIWIDGRTTEESENIIVYGHNMKNRTMFGSLRNYKEKDYYKEHKYIEFDTLYEKQTYEIISVSKAVIYYDEVPEGQYLFYEHVELDSKVEFEDYIKFIKENAYYDIPTTAEYGDQLITLCTCDYWTENARLIIIAKKI